MGDDAADSTARLKEDLVTRFRRTGLTLRPFAAKTGYSKTAVSDALNPHRPLPSEQLLQAIVRACAEDEAAQQAWVARLRALRGSGADQPGAEADSEGENPRVTDSGVTDSGVAESGVTDSGVAAGTLRSADPADVPRVPKVHRRWFWGVAVVAAFMLAGAIVWTVIGVGPGGGPAAQASGTTPPALPLSTSSSGAGPVSSVITGTGSPTVSCVQTRVYVVKTDGSLVLTAAVTQTPLGTLRQGDTLYMPNSKYHRTGGYRSRFLVYVPRLELWGYVAEGATKFVGQQCVDVPNAPADA